MIRSTSSLIWHSCASVSAVFLLDFCMEAAFWFNVSTSVDVSVICSPMIRIFSEVLSEFFDCSVEFATTWLTASCTSFMVPLVVSAAFPSALEASSRLAEFSEIPFNIPFKVSFSFTVTRDRSPISSFLFNILSSTQTVRSPSATLPMMLILFLILWLIDVASFSPTPMHRIIATHTAAPMPKMIPFTTASLFSLSVPTNTIPIISSSEPFW